MAGMSYDNYVGDGTTKHYTVSFPFINRTHVKATVNGDPASFTWLNPTTVVFNNAPPEGAKIVIYRMTPKNYSLVTFQDGAGFREKDLNLVSTQMLYLSQESFDSPLSGSGVRDIYEIINERVIYKVSENLFVAPIRLQQGVTTYTLAEESAARRIIFTSPNPCTVLLPSTGLPTGFHCLIRNAGGGSLTVVPTGNAVIENTILKWSDPTKYGSVLLESTSPFYTYFLMGGLEE